MKAKFYRFKLTVKATSKNVARNAVLYAFAARNPDGCEFTLTDYRNPKPQTFFLNHDYYP
jgi:hypothetical protein